MTTAGLATGGQSKKVLSPFLDCPPGRTPAVVTYKSFLLAFKRPKFTSLIIAGLFPGWRSGKVVEGKGGAASCWIRALPPEVRPAVPCLVEGCMGVLLCPTPVLLTYLVPCPPDGKPDVSLDSSHQHLHAPTTALSDQPLGLSSLPPSPWPQPRPGLLTHTLTGGECPGDCLTGFPASLPGHFPHCHP